RLSSVMRRLGGLLDFAVIPYATSSLDCASFARRVSFWLLFKSNAVFVLLVGPASQLSLANSARGSRSSRTNQKFLTRQKEVSILKT
ncbi:MAG: hypothetical protein IJ563_05055, partial [Selenomonadaceae bacterium]|nr:hypothetical protein [Selenomonadaceae bacterium]